MTVDIKWLNHPVPNTNHHFPLIQVHDDGTPTTKTFDHVKSEIGAEEAEEVGVEHLLRDIKDTTVGTLSQHLTTQVRKHSRLFHDIFDIFEFKVIEFFWL